MNKSIVTSFHVSLQKTIAFISKKYVYFFRQTFQIDTRSLGIFRICIATLVLTDLFVRSMDITTFYTDYGVLPRKILLAMYGSWNISIHALSGNGFFEMVLFLLAAVVAIALLVGYHTRVATIISWFLLFSLQNRNPVLNQGGDDLLRLLLFWSIFLPLGARFSLDSFRKQTSSSTNIFTIGTAAYYIQIILLYIVAYATKTGIEWHSQGTAIYYILHEQYRNTLLTPILSSHTQILSIMTHSTILFELFGPLFLFVPFFFGPLRMILVLEFMFFHLGMGMFLRLGSFPWVSAAAFIPLIPSWFWNNLTQRLRTLKKKRILIYYDEGCNFCYAIVLWIQKYSFTTEIINIPAQSDPGIQKEMAEQNSWVLVDTNGSHYYKFDAVLFLADASLIRVLLRPFNGRCMRILGTKMYEFIAKRRNRVCTITKKRKALPSVFALCSNICLLIFCLYSILWNLGTVVKPNNENLAYKYDKFGQLLGLQQYWILFAPSPRRQNSWDVIAGKLENGKLIDVFRNGNIVSWKKPKSIAGELKNERWVNFMDRVSADQLISTSYAAYICRSWNATHTIKLVTVDVAYITQKIELNNIYGSPKKVDALLYDCASQYARPITQ